MDFSIVDEIIKISETFNKPFNKKTLVDSIAKKLNLSRKNTNIYYNSDISIRFSSVANGGYSNTFKRFKYILENDDKPFLACIIRKNKIEFLLANSTFIDKVSHSSKILHRWKIRGSVNLSNIIRNFNGYINELVNFEELFKLHREVPQEDNIERIIENTKLIKSNRERFDIQSDQHKIILGNIQFIKGIESDSQFITLKNQLIDKVIRHKNEILRISKINNVNIRGNSIEQLITTGKNSHELGDVFEIINNDQRIIIDIKSKLMNYSSAPKAYNIDKLLEALSKEKTYFGYLFIGIDLSNNDVKARLTSFIDRLLIDNTKIQHHWSGQNRRGTTQLTDNIKDVFADDFQNEIDINQSKSFLEMLISI